jgi:hypothetical protein
MTASKWHGGKGSQPRPVDTDAYAKNWSRIFNHSIEHDKCGTPDCCGECDTAEKNEEEVKKIGLLSRKYGV